MPLFGSLAKTAIAAAIGQKAAGRGMLGAGLGVVATRIATRSLPGALLVGGGLLAKTLWDRRREQKRVHEAEAAFAEADRMKRAEPVLVREPEGAQLPPIPAPPVS